MALKPFSNINGPDNNRYYNFHVLCAILRSQALNLRANMGVVMLPDLVALEAFPTIGPDGEKDMNINGRAAEIECYLDLHAAKTPEARVRWTCFILSAFRLPKALEKKRKGSFPFMSKDNLLFCEESFATKRA